MKGQQSAGDTATRDPQRCVILTVIFNEYLKKQANIQQHQNTSRRQLVEKRLISQHDDLKAKLHREPKKKHAIQHYSKLSQLPT